MCHVAGQGGHLPALQVAPLGVELQEEARPGLRGALLPACRRIVSNEHPWVVAGHFQSTRTDWKMQHFAVQLHSNMPYRSKQ